MKKIVFIIKKKYIYIFSYLQKTFCLHIKCILIKSLQEELHNPFRRIGLYSKDNRRIYDLVLFDFIANKQTDVEEDSVL